MLGSYGGQLPAGPCTTAFHEAPKHVEARLEKKQLPRFISTTQFIDWNGGNTISVEKRGGR